MQYFFFALLIRGRVKGIARSTTFATGSVSYLRNSFVNGYTFQSTPF